ncbi:unnamed protein product [Spirodela intermedia]|uniref:Protein kinase domain-containing protein n=1 Tax=Spirodela intermedia TaxID=51605 RepID=A0A7I8IQQ8_SPIIN|nr:unnamed protein product [Spirodela intermedia]CAA6659875.1 unnamed protein product [Spirodela intermedia]
MEKTWDGTCGSVYKALNLHTNEIVAIKKMKRKFYLWEECMNLREVKCLRKLNHPNIIKLKEIVRENHELFFIFEYMRSTTTFSEAEIRGYLSQVLQGLGYMHKNGYFHRDLKPGICIIVHCFHMRSSKFDSQIADFGLAREITSRPPYTEYVSTKMVSTLFFKFRYRAPEVLLQFSSYSPICGLWCILAELFTLSPFFLAKVMAEHQLMNQEKGLYQIHKICYILGSPDFSTWPEGIRLSQAINFKFIQTRPINLFDVIPNASSVAIDLIMKLCSWDPQRRPTAEEALQHPFFHAFLTCASVLGGTWIPYPVRDTPFMPNQTDNGDIHDFMGKYIISHLKDDCFLGLTLGLKPSVSRLDASHQASQRGKEIFVPVQCRKCYFCSGVQDHPAQSVFWPLLSSDYQTDESTARAPLPAPYVLNSSSCSPTAFIAGRQTGRLSGHGFGTMMKVSSPMQQCTYFE